MDKRNRILVVDDEEVMRDSLTDWLREDGYEVLAVEDGFQALEVAQQGEWNVMLVDLKMPKMDGLEVIREIRRLKLDIPAIIITAYATVDTAVAAMKEGAYDYVVKPFSPEELGMIIRKIIEHQNLVKENVLLRKELTRRYEFQDMVGKSPRMEAVFELVKTVAPTKSTVLIQGESGTGKELVAHAIHDLSPRREGPFIALACAALPTTLLEAELFGHEKGAFTGAGATKLGKIELADSGTLFLDEIGDVDAKSQVDLLRVLQEREFRRLGGTEMIRVDVRVIVATNRDLRKLVEEGKFREDLFYRLNVINVQLPPLRDRREDIPLLADRFIEKFRIESRKEIRRISEPALDILLNHGWPGNVRELENAIEHAFAVCPGDSIAPENLPDSLRLKRNECLPGVGRSLDEMEKQHIAFILRENNGNVTRAAEVLGINRVTLYRKISEYGIKTDS